MQAQIERIKGSKKDRSLSISSKTITSNEEILILTNFLKSEDCPSDLELTFSFYNLNENLINALREGLAKCFFNKLPNELRLNFNAFGNEDAIKEMLKGLVKYSDKKRFTFPQKFVLQLFRIDIDAETGTLLTNIISNAPTNFTLGLYHYHIDNDSLPTLEAIGNSIYQAKEGFTLKLQGDMNEEEAKTLARIISNAPNYFTLHLVNELSINVLTILVKAVQNAQKGFTLRVDRLTIAANPILNTLKDIIPLAPEDFGFTCDATYSFYNNSDYYINFLTKATQEGPAGLRIQLNNLNKHHNATADKKLSEHIISLIQSGNYPNRFQIKCFGQITYPLMDSITQVNLASGTLNTLLDLTFDPSNIQSIKDNFMKIQKDGHSALTEASQCFLRCLEQLEAYYKTTSMPPIKLLMEENPDYAGPFLFNIFSSMFTPWANHPSSAIHHEPLETDETAPLYPKITSDGEISTETPDEYTLQQIVSFNTLVSMLDKIRERYPKIANAYLANLFFSSFAQYFQSVNPNPDLVSIDKQKDQFILALTKEFTEKELKDQAELYCVEPIIHHSMTGSYLSSSSSHTNIPDTLWPLETFKEMSTSILRACRLIPLEGDTPIAALTLRMLIEEKPQSPGYYGYLTQLLKVLLANETVLLNCQHLDKVQEFQNHLILPHELVANYDSETVSRVLDTYLSQDASLDSLIDAYTLETSEQETTKPSDDVHLESFIEQCKSLGLSYMNMITMEERLSTTSDPRKLALVIELQDQLKIWDKQVQTLKAEHHILASLFEETVNSLRETLSTLETDVYSSDITALYKVLQAISSEAKTFQREKHNSSDALSAFIEEINVLIGSSANAQETDALLQTTLSIFKTSYRSIILNYQPKNASLLSSISNMWSQPKKEIPALQKLEALLKDHLGILDPKSFLSDENSTVTEDLLNQMKAVLQNSSSCDQSTEPAIPSTKYSPGQ